MENNLVAAGYVVLFALCVGLAITFNGLVKGCMDRETQRLKEKLTWLFVCTSLAMVLIVPHVVVHGQHEDFIMLFILAMGIIPFYVHIH